METIEEKNNVLAFKAKISESLANAIRRYTFEIPVVAIEEVEIFKNDSALYDETIAHRLGLIPLLMPKVVGKDKKFSLKLSTKKEGMVYSKEFEGNIKPVYGEIPITDLEKGQEIELNAIAKVGKGREHSKFCPGLIIYRNVMDIKLEKDCPKEIVEICPKNIFEEDGGKIKIKDSVACDFCGMCLDFSKKQKKEFLKLEPAEELLITIESFGQLPPKDIFTKSLEELKKDLAEISKEIK